VFEHFLLNFAHENNLLLNTSQLTIFVIIKILLTTYTHNNRICLFFNIFGVSSLMDLWKMIVEA